MGILANENAIGGGNYLIERSLRFQSASSQHLSRTLGSSTDFAKWTWSGWVKRGTLGTDQVIIGGYIDANNRGAVLFSGDNLQVTRTVSGSAVALRITNAVFRDPSAWYHIVVIFDSNNATVANRIRIFVNGTEQTYSTSNDPGAGSGLYVNRSSTLNTIGQNGGGLVYFDGYLAEVNFIDGQALTPSSFGETDPLTGVWIAKRYTGTYGTNGFYLKFNDGTSTTTLGNDSSGNANNWTLTNFTRSAGVSDCWMLDVPSGNGSPTATQPSSNYAVLNPLIKNPYSSPTNANLRIALGTTGANGTQLASMIMPSGKWYFEINPTTANAMIGILRNTQSALYSVISGALYVGQISDGYAYNGSGQKYNSNTAASYGASFTNGDIIGCYFDASAGTLGFTKNGVDQGTAYSGLTGEFYPAISDGSGNTANVNFGQRSFAYTPPSGFRALCTANLP